MQLARMLAAATSCDQPIVLCIQFEWIGRKADPPCIPFRSSIAHARKASHTARQRVSAKI